MSNKYPGGIITSGAPAGYSVFFDGNGDFLTVPNNSAFLFGTGDFTVEFWVNFSSISATYQCIAAVWQGSTNYAWNISINNANVSFAYGNGGSSGSSVTFACTPTTNTWAHFAVTRASNSVRCFLNGAQIGTTQTISNNLTSGTSLYIGANQDAGPTQYVNGYVSNLRIIKGTALYTAAFTPPTQLFAITNTSLLTCNSPAIVDQSSNNFTITANGNAAVSTFTPFTGTQLVPNPNTLANTQGVWSISDAAYWMSQNKWPMPPNYPLQSLRFNSADSANLTRTPGSATNRKTWTWSGWVKRSKLGAAQMFFSAASQTPNNQTNIIFTAGDALSLGNYNGSTNNADLVTTSVYRDVSAWYHIVVAVDTTQATASNRIKLYVNGVQITAFSTSTYFAQNDDTYVNSTKIHSIGRVADFGTSPSDIMLADVYLIDGQALTPSSFGANDPNTGVWSPVPYSGTYGTNGFRLSFQDNTGATATTLGRDYSGNGNNWTPNNFSVAAGSGNDSLTDGPTNWGIDYGNGGEVRGNYATINPLMTLQFSQTYSNGNLECTGNYAYVNAQSTICVSSGKWYAEAVFNVKNSALLTIGAFNKNISNFIGNSGENGSVGYWTDGTKTINGTASAYGATYGVNDVIGVAMDVTGNSITFYKNGVSQGAISYTFDSSGAWGFLTSGGGSFASGDKVTWNFGQRPFAYPAPSGFKVLCTTNLPIPTVGATSTTLANDYFDAVIYTGNGSSPRTISSLEFQPDMVWVKNRSISLAHTVHDVLRGTGTNKALYTNSTADESAGDTSLYGYISAFTSNGFTATAGSSGSSSQAYFNTNNENYVAWAWKANGAGVSNTAGSITSTVSANTTAGISIVTYTTTAGTKTVGHGLGAVPRMLIVKPRNVVGEWYVYHGSLSNTQYLWLNSTNAVATDANLWASTTPTSAVFTLGSSWGAGNNFVAYCFAEIAGFSKFGSYTGNGSTDGPFIFTGFRPRYVMVKRTDAVEQWLLYDTARNPYNLVNLALAANSSAAEATTTTNAPDLLSNGFKWRGSDAATNASGGTYIFMAFAESPFNYSRAR